MSPEKIKNEIEEKNSSKIDIWSLDVSLFLL